MLPAHGTNKHIIYNKPTRCNSGSIAFIKNYKLLVVFNKHNTARVASCWFIIYYRLVMHGNSNIKKKKTNNFFSLKLVMFRTQ